MASKKKADEKILPSELSAEMVENIKNYGDKIETIDDYVQAIRQTIGYHIGAVDTKAHIALGKEIVQNAYDEAVRKDSPCNTINIIFDERNMMLTVEDNGRGIPFDLMVNVYTKAYTSTNYTKEEGDYTAGTNGSGTKIAVALSNYFRVESYVLGEARYLEANEGYLSSKKPLEMKNPGKQGTKVQFIPSSVIGKVETTCEDFYKLIFGLFPLLPLGTTVRFTGINKAGQIIVNESRTNQDGIVSDLIVKTTSPLIAPLVFSADNKMMKAEIAFTYDTQDLGSEDVSSFANFCITLGGTHKDGFLDGLSNYFRNYMNKIYLGEKSKLTVVGNDVRTGLKAVVNASHIKPIFNAQAKEILQNTDMYQFVRTLTTKAIEEWVKTNPNDMQKLCKFFKDVAESRAKSDEQKIRISDKYQKNLLSGKPKSYVPPSGNKNLEFIIVEGKSAFGATRNSRNSACQGIFPIRGKIPNAFATERTKFLSNVEVASIIDIIGGGYGKSFDIDKVKWEKIICMADADADGSHIDSLLLRFFLLYMPDLIRAGKLYRAVPPLYGVSTKKGTQYFTNKIEFTKHMQTLFTRTNSLTSTTNQKLSGLEITELFLRNIDYVYELEIVSNTYAIDPYLLENILMRLDLSFKEFKKDIEKIYRFLKVKQINGITIVEGLMNERFHTVFLNDRFIDGCSKVLSIIRSNVNYYYNLNGVNSSLYIIMKTFENNMPSNITRYKGLGEQTPDQLGESVLRPDSDRTLIRYTIEDIKEEINMIRFYESNKAELLRNITITRQDIE